MPFINLSENLNALDSDLLALWQKLALTTSQADPVCCGPAWNLAFHHVFYWGQRIFYLASGDSLIIFGEHFDSRNHVYLSPVEDSWLFGQPLLGFDAPELLEEALYMVHIEYGPRFPIIALSGLRMGTPLALKLITYFGGRFEFFRNQRSVLGCASLEGGLDGWLSRRSANHRAKLKKASRQAAKMGIYFERHCPIGHAECESVYNRMLAVERKSWKGINKCGMAESPSKEFYANLLAAHSIKGTGRVIFCRYGTQDIGFIFGCVGAGCYRGQQFSYDDNFKHLSIGNLMQLEKIRWLCEDGFLRYDMGPMVGDRMQYKIHWVEQALPIETWLMCPR